MESANLHRGSSLSVSFKGKSIAFLLLLLLSLLLLNTLKLWAKKVCSAIKTNQSAGVGFMA